jgi:hypothetical protein
VKLVAVSIGLSMLVSACMPHRNSVAFDMRDASPSINAAAVANAAGEIYEPVPYDAASILGCSSAPQSPICEVGPPTAEEDSAFRAEGARLASHADFRCRRLGAAIAANESGVMMYRKALVRSNGARRLYGVGHTYELYDEWMVRVARRIDDLNERTLEEKTRTLRHEMSHTIGATETPGNGWTAEDYAERCG